MKQTSREEAELASDARRRSHTCPNSCRLTALDCEVSYVAVVRFLFGALIILLMGCASLAPPDDRRAERRSHHKPEYPRDLLARGVEGYVVLAYDVTADGRVETPEVVVAVPEGVFDKAALDAVARWRFYPARANGENVPSDMKSLVSFCNARPGGAPSQRPLPCRSPSQGVNWLKAVLELHANGPVPTGPANAAEVDADHDRDYLRRVVFAGRGDTFLIHWGKRKMPLAVYLPPPPDGLFDDPEGVADVVRDGVLDWTDVAGPGVPSFEFVDDIGDADIPVVWAEEPDGDWYIAFCSYDISIATLRMGVNHILVTGRRGDGEVASMDDIYTTLLHEMGHALGLGGHSDDMRDIMYPSIGYATELSPADRLTLQKLYKHGSRRYSGRRAR